MVKVSMGNLLLSDLDIPIVMPRRNALPISIPRYVEQTLDIGAQNDGR